MNEPTEDTNVAPENGQATEAAKVRRVPPRPPSRVLPSDRMPFEKQLTVLKAFCVAYETNGGKPVTNEEVGKIVGMSPTTVVQTNAFCSDIGLLVRQKDSQGFIPGADAMAYHKACEWGAADAGKKLMPALEKTWAAQTIVPRLKLRAHDEREVIAALAEACNAVKDYEDRLVMLLNYLVEAGVVVRDGSTITAPTPKEYVPAEGAVTISRPRFYGGGKAEMSLVESLARAGIENREYPLPDENHAEFTFVLDAKRGRKVVVKTPHDLTKKEIARLHAWLDIQLVADDGEEAPPT